MGRFFTNEDVVLFQGDSITDCFRLDDEKGLGNGYAALVKAIYGTLYPQNQTTFINRGISGNRVRDLLKRYKEDFLELKPSFISILIGINDVWRGFDANDPCPHERFESEYISLLESIKSDLPEAKIMIIEPFVLHSLPDREKWHSDLGPKREIIASLADKYADYFLPLHTILTKKAEEDFCNKALAEDGVHPSAVGHAIIAAEYLKLLNIL